MKLVNIGFGNFVQAGRIVSVLTPDSAPTKRIVAEARETGKCLDATCGRRTRSVLVMDTNHVVLSAIQSDTLVQRMVQRMEKDNLNEE